MSLARKLVPALLLCALVLSAAAENAGESTAAEQERLIKSKESATKVVILAGRNFLYFAQNSPEWTQMFSQERRRNNLRFGDSGCTATAFANATVNCLPYERLRDVARVMKSPVFVDESSLARFYGHDENRFRIESGADTLRFWPLVIGNLAAGNNTFRFRSDRSAGFYTDALAGLGLRSEKTTDVKRTIEALRRGAVAITCSSGSLSPFSVVGHYFVLAAADDEYVYILDSFQRDEYKKNFRGAVEPIEPGVLRAPIGRLSAVGLQTQRIIWPEEDFVPYTAERLKEILAESDAQIPPAERAGPAGEEKTHAE